MNISDNKLDDLFRSQLDKESKHDTMDKQWNIVATRLQNNNRKRGLLWLLGFSVLVAFSGFYLWNIQGNTLSKNPSISESTLEIEQQALQPALTPNVLKETTQQTLATKVEDVSKPKPTKENKSIILSAATTESPDPTAPCNCPDDYIDNPSSSTRKPEEQSIATSKVIFDTIENEKTELNKNTGQLASITPLPTLTIYILDKNQRAHKLKHLSHVSFYVNHMTARPNFYFSTGLVKDYSRSFIDSTSLAPYLLLGYSVSKKMSVSLRYHHQNIHRAFDNSFGYQIPTIYGIPSEAIIDKGIVIQGLHTLDLALDYKVIKYKGLQGYIKSGVLLEKQSEGKLNLTASTIYLNTTEDIPLEAGAAGLTQSYGGIGLSYPVISRLQLNLEYLRLFSLSDAAIDWRDSNRFSLGLSYHLN